MLPYIQQRGHTQLTTLRLSNNQLYSRLRVWQDQSNQYCTKPINSSPPSAPLYTHTPREFLSPDSTLTYTSLDTHPIDPQEVMHWLVGWLDGVQQQFQHKQAISHHRSMKYIV